MQRFRFPIAVALTSLALVAALIGAGGLLVSNALAIGPFSGGGGGSGPWGAGHAGWQNTALPPELDGLTQVPASERFSHLRSVRVQLTDKDNKPVTVDITPGTATTVSPTSLTMTANDGSTHTFAIDDKTINHSKSGARDSASGASSALSQNDKVIVATLNNSSTATAVVAINPDGFGPRGPFGR